jgi:hypothetical protein
MLLACRIMPNTETTPETPFEPTSLRESLHAVRDELRTLADEIRVRAHLGGMDAKDAWARAEERLFTFEQQALAFGADAKVELQNAEGELIHAWGDLKVELLRIRDLLSGADNAA